LLIDLSKDAVICKDVEKIGSFEELRDLILKYKEGYIKNLQSGNTEAIPYREIFK
jgi:hypothetical protein